MSAVISGDGVYRYRLDRQVPQMGGKSGRPLAFCMLNPSTADAERDDPTIRRCLGFARREQASGLIVVNVYAYRATDPKALKTAKNPVGPHNRQHIIDVANETWQVICAWGTHAKADDVISTLGAIWSTGAKTFCLGQTKAGHPRHPLYVRADQPLVPWSPRC